MVSQQDASRPGSRDRLLAAAAAEFAARGFDGAKVDRITRRARVNKAMLYYHFHNKAALYREILARQFRGLAVAVTSGREQPGTPDEQLHRFIHTVAGVIAAEPHFPAIWLREMAEGGRHLDASIVTALRDIIATLAAILKEGQRAGIFAAAHPLITQIGIVAPLLLFAASAPLRERFKAIAPASLMVVPHEAVVAHVETVTLAALHARGRPSPASPKRTRRTRA
ncbi:MAG TPA: TetR/AcrR family transcriptional regulator [Vicinamibacterales bacterium]|jgi:TetR/AcrR family transcriptional regulator|nr:TetR/AcrR family transcriptional regulator [Vicinamibacterales bacterium]